VVVPTKHHCVLDRSVHCRIDGHVTTTISYGIPDPWWVCRQTHAESRVLFFGNATFRLTNDGPPRFVEGLTPPQRNAIRTVEILALDTSVLLFSDMAAGPGSIISQIQSNIGTTASLSFDVDAPCGLDLKAFKGLTRVKMECTDAQQQKEFNVIFKRYLGNRADQVEIIFGEASS
jgi:hypothetical protein